MILTETKTYKLWESAGHKIMEAQLSPAQIQQLFKNIENIETAGGQNRTLLGKGKDAASAVNKAWENLKSKVQNSGPIQNVDAMYDKAAEQLKQATGGDQGVMQYVQKYRDFAKKHPVAQSLIYSALIAAAGISGAGLGGAAALGLFKMVDKLLQGEKFSSSAYSGAKTGAMAYAAGQIGQAVKGSQPADTGQLQGAQGAPGSYQPGSGIGVDAATQAAQGSAAAVRQQASNEAMKAVQQAIANGTTSQGDLSNIAQSVLEKYSTLQGGPLSVQTAETLGQKIAMQAASGAVKESIDLSESQIYLIIGKIVERHKLSEGIMDTIKGAAGKAVDWAKTKGTNLTTKVTADKLLQVWKKAGSPTDSDQVAQILQNAGIDQTTIGQVYKNMNLGSVQSQTAPEPQAQPQTDQVAQAPAQPQTDQVAQAPAQPQTGKATSTTYAQVKELVKTLDKRTKTLLIKKLKKDLGINESMRLADYEEKAEELHRLMMLASKNNDIEEYERLKKERDKLDSEARKGMVIESDDEKQKYVQAAKDILKGAKPDHIQRVRNLDPEILRKHVSYAWDKLNSGEYKLNRPDLDETRKDELIGGLYHPDDFDEMVLRLKAKAEKQEAEKQKVKISMIADKLMNRIMVVYPDIIRSYGHEIVGDAIMHVSEMHKDVGMIGPNEISNMVREVKQLLDVGLKNLEEAFSLKDQEHIIVVDNKPIVKFDSLFDAYKKFNELRRQFPQKRIYIMSVKKPKDVDVDEGKVIQGNFNNRQQQAAAHKAQQEKEWQDYVNAEVAHEKKLKRLAAWWWNNDESPVIEKILAKMGYEIGQDDGYDDGGAFVVMAGDENGDTYVSWPATQLERLKEDVELTENLRKWFKEKWVRFGPDGKIRGACARGSDSEGKPKCLPQAKAHALGKKGRKYAAAKKRREDPNPERRGPAKNVATKKKSNEGVLENTDQQTSVTQNTWDPNLFKNGFALMNATGMIGSKEPGKPFQFTQQYIQQAIDAGYNEDEIENMRRKRDNPQQLEKDLVSSGKSLINAPLNPQGQYQKSYGMWMTPLQQSVTEDSDELYGLRVGDIVKTEINGKIMQGIIIDIFPESKEVELSLVGPGLGKTVTVDVRDTQALNEQDLDEACWKGYHKEGNKKMFGKTYPNCVKNTSEAANPAQQAAIAIAMKKKGDKPKNEEQLDEKCWDTHKQVGMKNKGGRMVPNCVPKESVEEAHEQCPECGGPMFSEMIMNEKKDACYYKVKSRYKVWPSAYASGALVKCRKKGASNWGTGGKKNESAIMKGLLK